MPISTAEELESAASVYPYPIAYPVGETDLTLAINLQHLSWTYRGLTLQEAIELFRALAWDEATRVIQRGEIGLIMGVLTSHTASRTLLAVVTASRAIVAGDVRALPAIVTQSSAPRALLTGTTGSSAVLTGDTRIIALQE